MQSTFLLKYIYIYYMCITINKYTYPSIKIKLTVLGTSNQPKFQIFINN